jgi:hypothetical protein
MHLTEEQMLTLAPDEASKKSGKDLASPSKWQNLSGSEIAVWGECQGSGSKPYQTSIDLSNIAFKCSCPSRKFPCKHGIALGLMYARNAKSFGKMEPPAWVSDWLQKRTTKEEKKADDKESKPVDAEAQAKRQANRENKVKDGVEELIIWIKDLIRNGILSAPEKGYAFWGNMSRRMIDAQAPGLAGMLKSLGDTDFFREGWESVFLERLLDLYLVSKSYHHFDAVPELIKQDIRTWIGFTISQDELKTQKGITDHWMVLGKSSSTDDNITTERFWLYGNQSKNYALVLQFIVRGQTANILLSPGMVIEAELVYFPSVTPMRALIKNYNTVSVQVAAEPYPSLQAVAEYQSLLYAAFPVQTEKPYIVQKLTPVKYNGKWLLKDAQGFTAAIPTRFKAFWKLLSISGGQPMDMAVIGKENEFEPIGVWAENKYLLL